MFGAINCSACHQSQSQTAFGSSVSGSSSFVFPSALPLEPSNQCTCGATTSAFGGQSFPFGGQSTAPAFQSSGFGASSMSAFGSTTMSGSFESPFQQSQPGFSLSITFPSSPCGPTRFEVSCQPASNNTSAVFGQCVGLTVTPFFDKAPKSTAFTFPPACIQISVNPCSSSTSTNQSDPKKSSFFTPFQSAPSRCQCAVSRAATYDQTPQAHNCTNTTPKSTDNTFGPECTQKSVNPCSSSTSTNMFSPMKSTSSNPAQSTQFRFCPNHGSPFGCQCSASKVTLKAETPKADNGRGAQPAEKLFSISAMPAYKEKSHEELRCEDYQLGDKGGTTRSNMQLTSFTFTPAISHTHANPFSSFTSTEPCVPKTSISQALSVSLGTRVTPYAQTLHADNGSDTTSKSTGFHFPHPCSKPVNQSYSFSSLIGTPNGQTPQADNGSDTTPKLTGFTFSPTCSKSASLSSSTTSPNLFGTPYAQKPKEDNVSDTTPKSTDFTFPPGSKLVTLSSSTSPSLFGTPYAQKPKEDIVSDTTPKSNDFTFPPACSESVTLSSSTTSPNLFGTPNAQKPKEDNVSDTTPKSTGFTFPPACSKSATLGSSTSSPSLFGTPYAQKSKEDNVSDTTPKSTGFTFPPACSKSATLGSSTSSPSLFGTPYAQKPKEDNVSDTTPKSTGFTFPPGSKLVTLSSSTTSPSLFGTPYAQEPKEDNVSDTTPKSTGFTFPPV